MGEPDDWNLIFKSKDIAWGELIKNLVTPWSQSKYWFNQIDGVDQIAFKRIGNGFALKSIEAVFGCHFLPFYVFGKAIFFSGVVALVFLLVHSITMSLPFSLAGALFFLLVPAHYAHVLWVADPVTIAQFFIVLGVWIFLYLTINMDQQRSMKRFLVLLGSLFLVGLLGIKTKEPALILPMILGLYCLTRIPDWKDQKTKAFLLLGALGLIAFQIVPIQHLNASGGSFTFHWDHLLRMVFKNHHCGYEDETVPAFFSIQRIWPVSIARTFGFFPLWTLVILVALYGFVKKRAAAENFTPFLAHPLVVICLIWVVTDVALFGLFTPEPRFLGTTFVPLTLLAIRLVWCIHRSMTRPWRLGIVVAVALAAGWTTFYNNLHSILWLRANIGMRNNQFVRVAQVLYQDQFPGKSFTMRDVALFYCPSALYATSLRPRMEDVTYFTELPRENWNKTRAPSREDFARNSQNGYVYWVTFSKEGLMQDPRITLLQTIDGINHNSLSDYLLYTKFPLPERLYIFKLAPR